jgi:hypothetical protein
MRSLAWSSALVLTLGGCSLYDLPDTPPGRDQVFAAAQAVIQERYPMSTAVKKSDHLFALTPVEVMGGSKARRKISVWVKQNYTGAWEPAVRVVLQEEYAQPPFEGDPSSVHPDAAMPVVKERWRPLEYLPVEEQELTEAIRARIEVRA